MYWSVLFSLRAIGRADLRFRVFPQISALKPLSPKNGFFKFLSFFLCVWNVEAKFKEK